MVAGLTPAPTARGVLADVALLGPAFALATGPVASGGLVPLARLLDGPGVLRGLVEAAASRLGTAEHRVAASWVFGGMAARLVAPVLAAAAVHGALPVLTGADLRWRDAAAPDGPCWWVAVPHVVRAPDGDEVHGELIGPLAALASALRLGVPVSERLLWGEVAAAVVKASRAVVVRRPAAAGPATALATTLLDRPPLLGARTAGAGARATCCLAYRVSGGHTCADCPLGPARPGADVLARPRRGPGRPAPRRRSPGRPP